MHLLLAHNSEGVGTSLRENGIGIYTCLCDRYIEDYTQCTRSRIQIGCSCALINILIVFSNSTTVFDQHSILCIAMDGRT